MTEKLVKIISSYIIICLLAMGAIVSTALVIVLAKGIKWMILNF